jgi:hypothetical protein
MQSKQTVCFHRQLSDVIIVVRFQQDAHPEG